MKMLVRMADAARMRMFMGVERMEISVALFDPTEFPYRYRGQPSRYENGDDQIAKNSEVESGEKSWICLA